MAASGGFGLRYFLIVMRSGRSRDSDGYSNIKSKGVGMSYCGDDVNRARPIGSQGGDVICRNVSSRDAFFCVDAMNGFYEFEVLL